MIPARTQWTAKRIDNSKSVIGFYINGSDKESGIYEIKQYQGKHFIKSINNGFEYEIDPLTLEPVTVAPKKIIHELPSFKITIYHCPNCEAEISEKCECCDKTHNMPKYCPSCGQRIDRNVEIKLDNKAIQLCAGAFNCPLRLINGDKFCETCKDNTTLQNAADVERGVKV